ncbi:hypothetical protein BC826DRAFT_1060707 [Russula brevipes]|nr:hypothetical protein BC826DRAFT_1060707 [Russula brevipes]
MRHPSSFSVQEAGIKTVICAPQISGQYHSLKGTVVETVGDATEHASGEAELNTARAKGYAEGTVDRLGGKKDAVVGAISGDRQQEAAGQVRRDKGEVQQDINPVLNSLRMCTWRTLLVYESRTESVHS